MTQFKKTQSVGAAVVAALGFALIVGDANAAAVTAAAGEFSKQFTQRTGAVTAGSTSVLPNVTITTAAASISGDRMTITLGGTAGAQFAAVNASTLACAGGGGTWTYVAASSTATTRVFQADGATAAGVACTLGASTLTNASLGAATPGQTITVAANITRDVTTVDSAPAQTVATVVDQFSATVALAWNGVIDYATNDGREFTDAADVTALGTGGAANVDDTTQRDRLAVLLADRQGTTIDDATLDTTTGLTIVINGDFSALANTTEGCLLPGTDGGNSISVSSTAGAIGAVTSTDCNSITVTLTGAQVATVIGTASDLLFIDFNANNTLTTRKDIKWQAFTGSASYSFVVAASAVVQSDAEASFAPGAHTASGSRIFVPYVPVGTGISQVIQLANTSARTGTVTMTASNQNGLACTSANMGGRVAISATRITDLSAMLAAGIANCYSTGSHKLYVVVTADIPDTAAELYTSYNVSGNRVAVVNSSNGRVTGVAGGNNDASGVGGANSSR